MPFIDAPRLFRRKSRKVTTTVVDLLVSPAIYEQLKERALEEGVSEGDELLLALTRGMEDYWLHVAEYEKERFELIEKLFERSKHDAELLDALIRQNQRFREILKSDETRGEPRGQQ